MTVSHTLSWFECSLFCLRCRFFLISLFFSYKLHACLYLYLYFIFVHLSISALSFYLCINPYLNLKYVCLSVAVTIRKNKNVYFTFTLRQPEHVLGYLFAQPRSTQSTLARLYVWIPLQHPPPYKQKCIFWTTKGWYDPLPNLILHSFISLWLKMFDFWSSA